MELVVSNNKFSKKEAIGFGWKTTKSSLRFFVLLFIVFLTASIVPSMLGDAVEESSRALSFLFGAISFALNVIMSIGLIKIALYFLDGEKAKVSDLFSHHPLFFRYLGGLLLYWAIVFVGFILFIIPGIVWLVKYQFFGYLIIDKNMKPLQALRKSGEITQGSKWNLLFFLSILGLINMGGALLFGVGLLLTIPITLLAYAYVYRKLLGQSEVEVVQDAKIGDKMQS